MKQILGTFFAVVSMTAPAAAAAQPSCRIPGGRTVARDRVAELIAVPTPQGSALYACIRRNGRKIALADRFTHARLAGRWVAWQRHAAGSWRIVVYDLRARRARFVDGHVARDALFLTTTGTAVWANRLPDESVGVFANDLRTGGHLLGRGAIDPASLRLSGRHVTWREGTDRFSADVR